MQKICSDGTHAMWHGGSFQAQERTRKGVGTAATGKARLPAVDVLNNDPTHDRSGQLDVVVTRREQSCSAVTTYDAGLSGHKLLTWAVDGSRADPPAVTVNYCPWRAVSMEDLRAALNASSLCMPDQWTSVDDLALLHDTVFTELEDRFVPLLQVTRRPRQSVYRKDRFSARSYFCCTPLTSQHWSGIMDYMSTSMLTTLKYMDCSPLSTDQLQSSISALTMLLAVWRQIGSS